MRSQSGAADTAPEGLRFGIMVDRLQLRVWEARCLAALATIPNVQAALVILNDEPPAPVPGRRRIARLLRRRDGLFTVVDRLAGRGRAQAFRPAEGANPLAGVPIIRCRVRRKGRYSEYFAPHDVGVIRGHGLHFILRFGFGIVRGDVLAAARFGVWSFHHGDEQRYRGGPAGFWEIVHGDPITGAVLQRLTNRLDAGVILHKGYFATVAHSYARGSDHLVLGTADWPARVCKDILNGHAGYLDAPPVETTAPVFRAPTNGQTLRFLVTIARNFAAVQYRALFRSDQWNIGVVDAPIHAFLAPGASPPVRWLPHPPPSRFRADPFGVEHEGRLTVLAEEFDHRTDRGSIVALTLDGDATVHATTASLRSGVHLSYPYLLRHEGTTYCIPETAQAGEVGIYAPADFPRAWRHVGTLLPGVRAADATVFAHDGLWWLLCTMADDYPETKLYGWYARDPFGPWRPHAANPLKTDVRGSRPAGPPFVHEGGLYRPAQDATRGYGGAVVMNRVLRLTPTQFAEEPVRTVAPYAGTAYGDGLHTLSAVGDRTLVDGRRARFVPVAFRRELARKVGRLGRAIRSRR